MGRIEWKGPWHDKSEAWNKYPYIRSELDKITVPDDMSVETTGVEEDANDGSFWMLFKDFMQFFCYTTICYTSDRLHHVKITEQPGDEKWSVSKLEIPENSGPEPAFISLYQYNQKFQDPFDDIEVPDEVVEGEIDMWKLQDEFRKAQQASAENATKGGQKEGIKLE